jgi:precorrin-3B synthase
MPSGDGLIVRVRPQHARISASDLAAIARLARSAGNGIIELTRRGNLQLRGVSASSWPALCAELCARGLARPTPEEDAHPSLFVCPLSGLDPRCPALETLADELLDVLRKHIAGGRNQRVLAEPHQAEAAATAAPSLPDKFAVVLSGGSHSSGALSADIHVRLHPSHPDQADLLVAGSIDGADRATLLGSCAASAAPDALRALLQALTAHPPERRRMRDAVAADLAALRGALRPFVVDAGRREAGWGAPEVGYHTGLSDWFGYALPFGSASAEDWAALARISERLGSGELRFTPTRHVLVVGVHPEHRRALVELGQRRSFGVRQPPRALELVACSGSPACGSAHGETRALARRLGKLLGGRALDRGTVHVSGCEKSCARQEAADVTLVHTADGLRLGFGRDVAGTLLTRPISLDVALQQLSQRFVRAPSAASSEKSSP